MPSSPPTTRRTAHRNRRAISEALALTWPDIDLNHATVQIQRQRARHGDSTTQTKNKRPHTVTSALTTTDDAITRAGNDHIR